MNFDEHVASTKDDAARIVVAASAAGRDVDVPTCPEWRMADLLGHLGRVHAWARMNVERQDPQTRTRFRELPELPDDGALVEWFETGCTTLVDALESSPPDLAVWTWAPPGEARFWARRMAHETAIHRLDAELAAGRVTAPFDPRSSVDGIDEVLVNMAYRPSGSIPRGNGESLHVHATDEDGEWLVRLTPDGPDVTREHAKGDVAARGPAAQLFSMLWGRWNPDDLEVLGDEQLLARFLAESTV